MYVSTWGCVDLVTPHHLEAFTKQNGKQTMPHASNTGMTYQVLPIIKWFCLLMIGRKW
jgi:hypothetical protein